MPGEVLDEAVSDEANVAARKVSDDQLNLGRILLRLQRTGRWRKNYASFDDYAMTELKLSPGQVRDLMRVQRTVEALGLTIEEASEIGFEKLRTVSTRLSPGNSPEVLADLRTTTIQAVRSNYCPKTRRQRRPATGCTAMGRSPPEPRCDERAPRGTCGAAMVGEPDTALNVPPLTDSPLTVGPQADAGESLPDASPEASRHSATCREAGLGGLENCATTQSAAPRRIVEVMPFTATAFDVARRYIGPSDDQMLFTFICAMFVSSLGSEAEKKWIREELPAELARRQAANRQLSAPPSQGQDPGPSPHPDHVPADPRRPLVDIALDAETDADAPSLVPVPTRRQPPE